MIKCKIYNGESAEELFGTREELSLGVEQTVKSMIEQVRTRGDAAVREYAEKLDGYTGTELFATAEEFRDAERAVSTEYKAMLKRAADNITEFHRLQKREGFELKRGGCVIGQKVTPLSRVGIYIPGGTAAYPSTVLMNALPAKIAGVGEIIMATPVKSDGRVRSEVLVAAALCGVDRVLKVGGVQAVAALAYGTESVPKADKITGPGNAYVAEAKRLISGVTCGIDMLAGPSEILVVADGNADPVCVAADMLSQAEHDKNASALLVSDSVELAEKTIAELYRRVELLPRRDIALASLENNCKVIAVKDISVAVELANEYAPEHLELCVKDPFGLLDKVKNAGSVFLGCDTPEAVGDYYAGANHTLPTSGTARFSSPLGVDDFVKTTQYMYYTAEELDGAADDIMSFAMSEGLAAHAESVAARTSGRKKRV